MLTQAKAWARRIKRDVLTVYFAARDPRAPFFARVLAAMVAAYALSPIDLIPDFVPILGYLDDLLIVPLGLLWVMRLMPPAVLADARQRAESVLAKPRSIGGAVCIVGIWLGLAVAVLGYVLA